MMGKRNYANVVAGTGIIISIFFFIYLYYPSLNIDATVAQTLFTLLPGFIVTAICIYITAEARGGGRLGGCLGVGIGLCYLLFSLNAEGLVTAEMLSGLTIPQLQTWVMVISTITGVIMYASSR